MKYHGKGFSLISGIVIGILIVAAIGGAGILWKTFSSDLSGPLPPAQTPSSPTPSAKPIPPPTHASSPYPPPNHLTTPSPPLQKTPSPPPSPLPTPRPTPQPTPTPTPCPKPAPGPVSDITIDACIQYQRMEGFGSTARLFEDSHVFNNMIPGSDGKAATVMPNSEQEKILDMLYVDLGLTRVRTQAEGAIEPVNDNNDPENTDISKFNFQFRRVDGLANHVKRAVARGVTTYFFSPLSPESWMASGVSPAEYAEWAMTIIRRYRSIGLEMPYYSIFNEPGLLTDTGQINLPGTFIRDAIKLLGPKLRTEGFNTKIVISDDVNPCEAYKRINIVLKDEQARQYVGALAYHLYDQEDCALVVDGIRKNSKEIKKLIKGLGEQYGISVWMSEFFVPDGFQWANLVHDLLTDYGASAVDYMWGFFGEWDNARSPISSLVTLKSSGSQYLGYEVQKHYYAVGQFSRYVKPGAIRVDAKSNVAGIKVTAFKHPVNNVFTIVAINNNPKDILIGFQADNANITKFSTVYRTSPTENWVPLPSVTLSNSFFTTTLKGTSITTFVGNL